MIEKEFHYKDQFRGLPFEKGELGKLGDSLESMLGLHMASCRRTEENYESVLEVGHAKCLGVCGYTCFWSSLSGSYLGLCINARHLMSFLANVCFHFRILKTHSNYYNFPKKKKKKTHKKKMKRNNSLIFCWTCEMKNNALRVTRKHVDIRTFDLLTIFCCFLESTKDY